jgi:hypothetical protein
LRQLAAIMAAVRAVWRVSLGGVMTIRRCRQCVLAVCGAIVGAISVATPVSAGPPDHIAVTYDSTADTLCDMSVVLDGFEHGTFMLKPRAGGLDLASFNGHFSIRVTNTATGRWFLAESDGMSKDLKVTDEGGGIIRVVSQFGGKDRYYSSDGTRVFQAAGNGRHELLIDLVDPNNPDDDILLQDNTIKDTGLRFGAADCDAIVALIG